MLSEPQDQKEFILIEMNERKRTLCFLILGMAVIFKITLTIFPLLSDKGPLTSSVNQAEAADDSVANKEPANDDQGWPPQKQETEDKVKDPSAWLEVMKKREMEMREKEEALQLKEERLRELKKDIVEKLTMLQQENEKLEAFLKEKAKLVEQKKKREIEEQERIKQLARIFESTPPEQAGNLLGKLPTKTAARILLKMSGRKAGKLWGFVNPDQAVKISQELSKMKQ